MIDTIPAVGYTTAGTTPTGSGTSGEREDTMEKTIYITTDAKSCADVHELCVTYDREEAIQAAWYDHNHMTQAERERTCISVDAYVIHTDEEDARDAWTKTLFWDGEVPEVQGRVKWLTLDRDGITSKLDRCAEQGEDLAMWIHDHYPDAIPEDRWDLCNSYQEEKT